MLLILDSTAIQAISLQSLLQEYLVVDGTFTDLLRTLFSVERQQICMDQFRKPPFIRHKQINPETPLPPLASDRHTDQLSTHEYFRRIRDSLEDTAAQVAISAPAHTTFKRDGLEDAPHLLVYGAICRHIEQRTDKVPPRKVIVCFSNYLKVVDYLSKQSTDGFVGKYFLGAYDGTISIPIELGHNEELPVNIAICIH